MSYQGPLFPDRTCALTLASINSYSASTTKNGLLFQTVKNSDVNEPSSEPSQIYEPELQPSPIDHWSPVNKAAPNTKVNVLKFLALLSSGT